jgi:DNA primase
MAATDIVDLIGRTVSLKKRGKDFLGLCPFHTEKTPSFHVNQPRQFYYCFGCKAAGDAINFVKQRDRVEFMDALKTLATDAGIPIPTFGRGDRQDAGETQICYDANSLAAMFFEKLLSDPNVGKAAREYLKSRGITPETAAKFHIGLAIDAWDALLKGPVGKKFSPQQLFTAGLVKQRDTDKGGFYDTFRNRLMFPIRDPSGRVIAFGGRVMPGSPPDTAKYLNSPESPVFSKSRTIYGLDLARQRIVETQTVVMVEGYTDVVMAHQFGAANVCAVLGTAMTEQHVNTLRRFANRIVLLFDPDTAGELAVDRAVSLFLSQPVEIAIASLGEDLDPDEYLLKYGLEAWEKLIAAAPNALVHKWRQLVRRFTADDADNLTGQQKAVEAYLELIAQARSAGPSDPIRWGLMVAQVSKLTGIEVNLLQKRLASVRPPAKPAHPAPTAQNDAGDSEVPQNQPAVQNRRKTGVLSARDRAECWILGTLLLFPDKWASIQTQVQPEDFTESRRRRLAEVYWNHQRDEGEPVFNEFLALLDDQVAAGDSGGPVTGADLRELAIEVSGEVETLYGATADPNQGLADAIEHLKRNHAAQEKQKLIASLRRSSEQSPDAPQRDAREELNQLQAQILAAKARSASA